MSEAVNLPVVPLRGAVLFPGVSIPIAAGRPGTLRAIEAAAKAPGRLVFAVGQRPSAAKISPDLLYTIGAVAFIAAIQRGLGGTRFGLKGKRRGIPARYFHNARG